MAKITVHVLSKYKIAYKALQWIINYMPTLWKLKSINTKHNFKKLLDHRRKGRKKLVQMLGGVLTMPKPLTM